VAGAQRVRTGRGGSWFTLGGSERSVPWEDGMREFLMCRSLDGADEGAGLVDVMKTAKLELED